MQKPETFRSWRDCEFVSMAEAARIVGRSKSWTQRAVCTGDLEAVWLPTGGPEVVTVASLARLIDRAEPAVLHFPKPRPGTAGAALRLVVNEARHE
jgi:hypothetical protein